MLAVVTRSAAREHDTPSSSSSPAAAVSPTEGGHQPARGKASPASRANAVPVSKCRVDHAADTSQLFADPAAPSSSSAPDAAPDAVDDQLRTFVDDIIEAYAADPFFLDNANTADMSHIEGLWWKDGHTVVPDSVNPKQLILQAMHDQPLAGHLGVTKTVKAISSRFLWENAAKEVRHYIRHCPTCQLQTTHPYKPTG